MNIPGRRMSMSKIMGGRESTHLWEMQIIKDD